jgi:rubrerythrin
MDTGGNHQYDCPLYSIPSYIISKEGNLMKEEKEVDLDKEQIEKLKEELEKARIEKESREKYPNPYKYYPSTYGWVCPVCGKGNAPWQGTCPCKNSWTVTWE